MIDELVKAANAIEMAGIKPPDWFPKLSRLPKVSKGAPCVRIWLTPDGNIQHLDLLNEKHARQLWKFEPNNGYSLPGFNYFPPNLSNIFDKVCGELEKYCVDNFEKGETLQLFLKAVRKIDINVFLNEFENKVHGTFSKDIADNLLKKNAKPSIFLDVYEYNKYPLSSLTTMERLSELLWLSYTPKNTKYSDAYSPHEKGLEDLYPPVSLPLLGNIKLRSQVKAIPAQKRYDCCESITFPTGLESRKRTKRALEWLSDAERNGETYGVAGDKELLFAYPRIVPKDKIPLAKLFGAQKDDSYQKGDKFERLAKRVIEQLRGQGRAVSDAQLEIFSLRKMDKARTKVVYYRNATVESLELASAAWHRGCQNIPALDVRNWSEDKNEKTGKPYPIIVEGLTVFPIRLHRHLNAIWKKDGTRADSNKSKARIFEPTDGLRLLLERQNEGLVVHMMERFMQHSQGYFLTLCRSTGKHEVASLFDKEIYPGILGLLLYKSKKNKEEFMKESAFLLGRCLRITDEIHRLYCEVVRKKDLPPELCGSSLLVSMMESPVTTLSQLAMRSAPYIKWARGGGEKGDKGRLVWYWLKQWEETADQLHTLIWPKRLIPEERAQIFLGYLASFPKSEKPNDNKTDSDNTTKQGDEI